MISVHDFTLRFIIPRYSIIVLGDNMVSLDFLKAL